MLLSRKKKKYILGAVILVMVLVLAYVYFLRLDSRSSVHDNLGLPFLTLAEIGKYNGENPELPIYIGLDGYVYDVTPGKNFYGVDGSYHDLAGKDASRELRIFGGDIIKKKYKIIGNFEQ